MNPVYERLKQAAGDKGFSEDPAEIAPHLEEWRGKYDGHTQLLLKPSTTEQVAAILAICSETGTAVVPQGGNTGLVGGQIPLHNEIVLSLNRMHRIREVDPTSNTITCEAGVTLQRTREAAAEVDRLYPQ